MRLFHKWRRGSSEWTFEGKGTATGTKTGENVALAGQKVRQWRS